MIYSFAVSFVALFTVSSKLQHIQMWLSRGALRFECAQRRLLQQIFHKNEKGKRREHYAAWGINVFCQIRLKEEITQGNYGETKTCYRKNASCELPIFTSVLGSSSNANILTFNICVSKNSRIKRK